MYLEKVRATVDQGNQYLEKAEHELNQPKEDVVKFLACSSSRKAIHSYLTAFLLKFDIDADPNESIAQLLDLCQEKDVRFKQISFENMGCSVDIEDAKYCTDTKTVGSCFELAKKTKNLVDIDPWPLSKRTK